jgi:hypothetical protein
MARGSVNDALSARDRAVLEFERSWWMGSGPKGRAIRARLGLSPSGYYRYLNRLVDVPEAARFDPLLVKRLRRMRSDRRRMRFEGDLGVER